MTLHAVAAVGNPKLGSRTRDAAERMAAGLGVECEVIEIRELGPGLLDHEDPAVAEAVRRVKRADILIAASPTYKATYTGLIKLFLDRFEGTVGLEGVVGIPLMLGAAPDHSLACELSLKPVLVELGATCPAKGLYQLEGRYATDGTLEAWLGHWRETVIRATRGSWPIPESITGGATT
jgi:FMN reductase